MQKGLAGSGKEWRGRRGWQVAAEKQVVMWTFNVNKNMMRSGV